MIHTSPGKASSIGFNVEKYFQLYPVMRFSVKKLFQLLISILNTEMEKKS